MEYISNNYEETINIGYLIATKLNKGDCLLLTGDLGAGKTTFTKGIGKFLNIKKVINSPTFTIVKTYKGDMPLYHLDLYRLDGEGNDFDLEDYFYSDGITVCEWPRQVSSILPGEYLEIKIERIDEDKRKITIIPVGSRYEGRF